MIAESIDMLGSVVSPVAWRLLRRLRDLDGGQHWVTTFERFACRHLVDAGLVKTDAVVTCGKGSFVVATLTLAGSEFVAGCPDRLAVSPSLKTLERRCAAEAKRDSLRRKALLAYGPVVIRGLPTTLGLLDHVRRNTMVSALHELADGNTKSEAIVVRYLIHAWDDRIFRPVVRPKGDKTFDKVVALIPAVRSKVGFVKARPVVVQLLAAVPVGTAAHDHLLLAMGVLDEAVPLCV